MSTTLWSRRWTGRASVGDAHRRSREVISPSGGIMRCKFPSRKNGRLVHCEGLLELDAAYLFEAHPRVALYREQPAPVLFPDGERIRRYTPDFELTLDSGTLIWVDVKPARSLADEAIRRKLRCIQDHMRRCERQFLVLTDEELQAEPRQSNVRTIWRRSSRTLPSRGAALVMNKRERTNSVVDDETPSGIAGSKWSQEEAIAYECARDYLGEVLGIYSGELDAEEARAVPRQDRLNWLEAEITRLGHARRQLRVSDHEAITEIRAVYGALLRREAER